MAKSTFSKTNITAGELSPRAFGRFDFAKFENAVKILENFLIYQTGGALFRPGTRYVAPVKYENQKTRLIPFQYSTTQTYTVEVGDYYMRFYSQQAQLVMTTSTTNAWITSTAYKVGDFVKSSSIIYYCIVAHTSGTFATDLAAGDWVAQAIYEIPTPYASADVFDIKYCQSADTVYLTHPDYAPYKLKRVGSVEFTLTKVNFIRGPFLDDNITNVTLTPSSGTGNATITATAAAWGAVVSYIPDDWVTNGGSTYKCLQPHISAATFAPDLALGYWKLYTALTIFDAGHVGSLWRIKSGVVKISSVTNGYTAAGTVQAEPDGTAGNLATTSAGVDWSEGAFSAFRGFPSSCTFHQQRTYYAGTSNNPQTFWGSVVSAPENFKTGSNDEDAVSFTISTEQVNAIRWLSSGTKQMQNGTSGGTFSATSSAGTIITAANIQVTRDTTYGVSNLTPKRISSYLYYLQRNGYQMRELYYNFYNDTQIAGDLTLIADHILRDGDGGVDMDHQQSPNDRLWVVRADGQMAVMVRNPEQEVTGWSRLVGGATAAGNGLFESISILQNDSSDDEVWVTVQRNISGFTRRYVELFTSEYFTDQWDPIRVDCSLSHDNPITISNIFNVDPVQVVATSHGLSDGDQVKIDSVLGMTELNNNIYIVADATTHTFTLKDTDGNYIDGTGFTAYKSSGEVREMLKTFTGLDHLENEYVTVQTDGGIPPAQQTYLVSGGAITLVDKAAVVHAGLPYQGTIQLLKLSDGSRETGQTKSRRIYLSTLRLFQSLSFQIGKSLATLSTIYLGKANDPIARPTQIFTGDLEEFFDTSWAKDDEIIIRQIQPLPLFILAAVLRSEIEER